MCERAGGRIIAHTALLALLVACLGLLLPNNVVGLRDLLRQAASAAVQLAGQRWPSVCSFCC